MSLRVNNQAVNVMRPNNGRQVGGGLKPNNNIMNGSKEVKVASRPADSTGLENLVQGGVGAGAGLPFVKHHHSVKKMQTPSVARRNARERNRVKVVNSGFDILKNHVPNLKNKVSKVETLRAAVEYIKTLKELLGHEDDPNNPPQTPIIISEREFEASMGFDESSNFPDLHSPSSSDDLITGDLSFGAQTAEDDLGEDKVSGAPMDDEDSMPVAVTPVSSASRCLEMAETSTGVAPLWLERVGSGPRFVTSSQSVDKGFVTSTSVGQPPGLDQITRTTTVRRSLVPSTIPAAGGPFGEAALVPAPPQATIVNSIPPDFLFLDGIQVPAMVYQLPPGPSTPIQMPPTSPTVVNSSPYQPTAEMTSPTILFQQVDLKPELGTASTTTTSPTHGEGQGSSPPGEFYFVQSNASNDLGKDCDSAMIIATPGLQQQPAGVELKPHVIPDGVAPCNSDSPVAEPNAASAATSPTSTTVLPSIACITAPAWWPPQGGHNEPQPQPNSSGILVGYAVSPPAPTTSVVALGLQKQVNNMSNDDLYDLDDLEVSQASNGLHHHHQHQPLVVSSVGYMPTSSSTTPLLTTIQQPPPSLAIVTSSSSGLVLPSIDSMRSRLGGNTINFSESRSKV